MSLPYESSGVQLVLAAQMLEIAADLAQRLSSSRDDPFAHDLVIVPDAGTGRVLSQEMARHLGTSGTGDGISAGITFSTIASWLPHLDQLLTGEPYHRRPWQAQQLPWQIAKALDNSRTHEWARQLMTYYPDPADSAARPGRRMYRARSLAKQYRRYLRDCPELLAQWAAGKNTVDTQDQWQAELWRVLLAQFGVDPVAHHRSLLAELRARAVPGLPHHLAIIAEDALATTDREIIEALGTHHDVVVYVLSTQLRGLSLDRCDAFGSAERAVQQQWSTISTKTPRRLVQPRPWQPRVTLHQCYGQDRQVEVLRDALLRILTERRDLEPRDIVVHCADIASFAPLITSAFAAEQDPSAPVAQLRVRLAVADPNQPNPVFTLLDELLVLATTRVDVSEMLTLLSQPVVMARFGLSHDSLHRIEELIAQAQIRWGIDHHHCQLFGLDTEQNTWSAGIDRLIAGIALDEAIHTSVGRALPLDDISAQDVPLIGALACVRSVLSESMSFTQTTHSLLDWLAHCRALLTALTNVTPETAPDLAQVYTVLSDLAETADTASVISLGDFRVLLRESTPARVRRTIAGTGSLIVTSATQLVDTPRTVTVLLGFDDGVFPRQEQHCGDDLRHQYLGSTLIGSVTRQRTALLRAATASDELIVICQNRHPLTNKSVPLAGAITDLVDLAAELEAPIQRYQHPLQRFSPTNFSGPLPRSFDAEACAGAQALLTGPGQPLPLFQPALHEVPTRKDVVTLAELSSFFDNPVRAFLRDRIGISTFVPTPADPHIPVTLDGLERWSIGTRILEFLHRGYTDAEALAAERLRGTIPPQNLGAAGLAHIGAEVRAIANIAAPYRTHQYQDHVIDLDLGDTRLTGVVATYGNEIVDVAYSAVGAKHLLRGWLALLALHTSEPGDWRWRMVGKRSQSVIGPIPSGWNTARGIHQIAAIARYGQTRPLPLSPRTSARYARTRQLLTHLDPHTPQFLDRLRRDWSYDREAMAPFYPTLESLFTDKDIPASFTCQRETTLAGALAMLLWNPILGLQENL